MMTENFPPVEELHAGAIDVTPVDRDWSEGYGETWEYIEAPECGECAEYARWISGEDLAAELGDAIDLDESTGWETESWETWRCANAECENVGDEIDPYEYGAEGPMMNYAYPFPGRLDQSDAEKIAHLPLCIVNREDDSELALTGGGMDFSWEICEAFMQLGFLPPAHFADLPGMAGRGRSERDKWIIAGCRRTAEMFLRFAQNRAEGISRGLAWIEERA